MPTLLHRSLRVLKHSQKTILTVFLLFAIWRIALFSIAALAPLILPFKPSFPYADVLLFSRNLPQWLVTWANFDGVHYLTIMEKGYFGTGLIQAFFPFYPALSKAMTLGFIDPVVASLVVSNLSFIALLFVLYYYTAFHTDTNQAKWLLIALLLFPTAFFFGAVYTESLFLLLVVASLWSAERRQWLLAGLFAALASYTRLVGIFLIPALFAELLQSQLALSVAKNPSISKNSISQITTQLLSPTFWLTIIRKRTTALIGIAMGSFGLLLYMWYLQNIFDDSFYFYHVQSEFGSGRQESLISIPQVAWRYLKILATYRPFDLKYVIFVQELLTTGLAYLLVLLSIRKIRWSWTLFALAALTLPTLTGTFSSMARYALVALPIYWFLSDKLANGHPIWKIWLIVSGLLLLFNTVLFIQGYWVA